MTVSGLVSLVGRVERTRNFRSASPRIRSASNRSLPTTSGTLTSGLRKERETGAAPPKRKTSPIATTIAILRIIRRILVAKLPKLRSLADQPQIFTDVRGSFFKGRDEIGRASCRE